MSWPASLLIAFSTGVLGLGCGGLIGHCCVGWYRISSFEGKAGYAVVGGALLGGIAGFVLGLIVVRAAASDPSSGFWSGAGMAAAAVLGLGLFVLLVCRLGANPTPDGDRDAGRAAANASEPQDAVARAFAALTPDALLADWLPFLFREPNGERTQAVIAQIAARQDELAAAVADEEGIVREQALRAAAFVVEPSPAYVAAVLAEGEAIAAAIASCKTMRSDDPQFVAAMVELPSRFETWKHAWWVVHERAGRDGRPPVAQIHELARQRPPGSPIGEIEGSARMLLEHLDHQAGGDRR
jgi:hypothetical protein